jgi:hypothetical protein
MEKGISDFCEEASQATGWDDGEGRISDSNGKLHKRIERKYNNDTDNQIILLVSSTNDNLDNAFKKIDKDDCNSTMYKIVDECPPGQDIPGIDWRHGGEVEDGNGLSWVIITDRAKYHPGICTFQVLENTWDGPEDPTKHHWATRTSIRDAEESVITVLGDLWDDLFVDPYASEKTDIQANTVPGLYSELSINSTVDGDKHELHFQVGNFQFSPSMNYEGPAPKCDMGEWSYEPSREEHPNDFHGYRTTNCSVYC